MALLSSKGGIDTWSLNSRSIATMRIVVASAILFIINPIDIDDFDTIHALPILYLVYSILVFVFAERLLLWSRSRIPYWADIGWATLLTIYADEPGSGLLFIFPIFVASFQWGFETALHLTVAGVVLMVVIGIRKFQEGVEVQLPEIGLPPLYLLVFGSLVARWGGHEMLTKRRLLLLKEINELSNPRFGVDRTICTMLERLRAFHNAQVGLLVVSDPSTAKYLLYRADSRNPNHGSTAEEIPAETTRVLLEPPPDQTVIFSTGLRMFSRLWPFKPRCSILDSSYAWHVTVASSASMSLVAMLDAESFISVPFCYDSTTNGRMYLAATRRRAFTRGDAIFLAQVTAQIIPMLGNIRLVDQLASRAAEEERRRLAHDIHDNVIQPYIGFQIALAALNQKVHQGNGNIAKDIAELIAVTAHSIAELRRYIRWLSGNGKHESVLVASVWRFVAGFSATTNIAVQVEAASDLSINDRLAAEVFQMVVEGLSNIRRHTDATCATIALARQNDALVLRIVNNKADHGPPTHFMPRSIAERAAMLGGQVSIECGADSTQVIVMVPL